MGDYGWNAECTPTMPAISSKMNVNINLGDVVAGYAQDNKVGAHSAA